jgi:hypothetical protein
MLACLPGLIPYFDNIYCLLLLLLLCYVQLHLPAQHMPWLLLLAQPLQLARTLASLLRLWLLPTPLVACLRKR